MTDWLMWQTIVTAILGIGTIALAVISAIVLYKSLDHNKKILQDMKVQRMPIIVIRPTSVMIKIPVLNEKHPPVMTFTLKNEGGRSGILSRISIFKDEDEILFNEKRSKLITPGCEEPLRITLTGMDLSKVEDESTIRIVCSYTLENETGLTVSEYITEYSAKCGSIRKFSREDY